MNEGLSPLSLADISLSAHSSSRSARMVQLRSQKESRHRQHPPPSFRISLARLGDEIAIDQRDEPYIDHRRVVQTGGQWRHQSLDTETFSMSLADLSLSLRRWPVCPVQSPFVDPASSEFRKTQTWRKHTSTKSQNSANMCHVCRLQRLAASVAGCGKRKVFLDPAQCGAFRSHRYKGGKS